MRRQPSSDQITQTHEPIHITSQEMHMNHHVPQYFTLPPSVARCRVRWRVASRLAATLAAAALIASPVAPALAGGSATILSGGVPPPPMGALASAASGQAERARAERVTVAIYEFRSSLPNVSAKAATDMFTTALMQTGRF